MVDISKYIVDGKVKRDRIVADVKRGRLSKEDILELDNNAQIHNAYFGEKLPPKKDKKEWTHKYLDELSFVAVSEAFSKDYLLMLNEVAEHVIKTDNQKDNNIKKVKTLICGLVLLLLIIFSVVFFILKAKKDGANFFISSIAMVKNIYLCIVKVLG